MIKINQQNNLFHKQLELERMSNKSWLITINLKRILQVLENVSVKNLQTS